MMCRIGEIAIWLTLEINALFMAPEALFPNGGPDMRAPHR
ncbi:hypothetical protein ROG8370_03216 [Roseovarius gaetbuli]|uniref:Uncharacterized protein n=1 Tax=Roseovarius gaetbuli TaxID=1356575 RepID=A0A1X7A2U2_9RHOB|nr:hypothetical protein ROG8370_03216 [Roseovarius gaetbuli]